MSSHLDRVRMLMNVHRPGEAAAILVDHLLVEPDDEVSHAMLANCFHQLGNLSDAKREIEQAIRLDPENGFCHYVHSFVLRDLKQPQAARKAIHEALRLSPNEPDYFAQSAELFCQARSYDKAIEQAERGLSINPLHVQCTCTRAFALICLERNAVANQALQQLLAHYPDHADVHATIGWVAVMGGKYQLAKAHFMEALRIKPENPWAERGLKQAYLGWCSSWLNFFDSPDDGNPNSMLAYLLYFLLYSWGYFALFFIPWIKNTEVPPKPDFPLKCLVALSVNLAVVSLFVGEGLAVLPFVFTRFGRRLLTRDQFNESLNIWGLVLIVALMLLMGEIGKNRAIYAAGCVLFFGTPLLVIALRPESRVRRLQFLGIIAAYFLAGGLLICAVATVQDEKGNVSGMRFWSTIVFHWLASVGAAVFLAAQQNQKTKAST